MSHPYRPSGEFLALLNAFCGGDLDAKQAEQLEEIICDNADAREFFIDYTTVHAGLCDISMSDLVPDATTADTVATETPLAPLSPTADDASSLCSSPTLTFPWGIPGRTLAVLCLLWLVTIAVPWALAICFFAKDADRGPWPAGRVFAEEPPGGIARLTECVDAVWAHTATDPALGSSFNEGDRLVLVEGFVEIACNGGARILMEGPATVQLPSANRIHLHRGRLNVVVPDETEDFTIETDRLSVTQRGAESGIMLDSSGTIEAHVLRGTVEVHRIENGRTADLRRERVSQLFPQGGTRRPFGKNKKQTWN